MWGVLAAVLAALSGFGGGLVVAHFTALLQRRNWQIQEAAKVYARLFVIGDEAMRLMNTLVNAVEKLVGEVQAPETVHNASKRDPRVKRGYNNTNRNLRKFRTTEDREFRHLLKHAWMLEQDLAIRKLIRRTETECVDGMVTLEMHFSKLVDKRQEEIDRQLAQRKPFGEWFETMEALRDHVAANYFHRIPWHQRIWARCQRSHRAKQ